MKNLISLFFLLVTTSVAICQRTTIDCAAFFTDERTIDVKLSTDIRKLKNSKKENDYQPASVTITCPDSFSVTENIRICARGVFRRANCYIPSTMLDFKNPQSPALSCLGKLKLVSGCATSNYDEELVLKEYLIYKLYNLVTEKSFRVRLLLIHYDDTKGKIKAFTQYAFLIEDVDDVARRNNSREYKGKVMTEGTNRLHMTLVSLFQFMVGNTDWAVPNKHNIKLILPRKDSLARPLPIPYDFDFAGLVDAPYATPAPQLGTESVKERSYRGFPRSISEIESLLQIFREKKDSMIALIKNFDLLKNNTRNIMVAYLEEFFTIIESKTLVNAYFITNARTQ